jgi:hypothetical protein
MASQDCGRRTAQRRGPVRGADVAETDEQKGGSFKKLSLVEQRQPGFDIRQCCLQSGSPDGARGALGKDALALEFQFLFLPGARGEFQSILPLSLRSCNCDRVVERLLFFHGLTFPSSRHTSILRQVKMRPLAKSARRRTGGRGFLSEPQLAKCLPSFSFNTSKNWETP